ncbi:MAG: hypothetical protein H0X24_03495 [Ktedonobacterales bacterium]|nr:hypothetical protein [Ktedonobacterales bacterium]
MTRLIAHMFATAQQIVGMTCTTASRLKMNGAANGSSRAIALVPKAPARCCCIHGLKSPCSKRPGRAFCAKG